MHLTTGTRLGPYEVVAPIGAGGMGEVYRGRDTRLDRDVAIKVLPQGREQLPETRERFQREARAISHLTHPHVCTLFDVGQHEGSDYLVMEYLDGQTLADRIARGPLPFADVLRFGAEIADALDAAHRAGIAHRDLKPGNIVLTRTGVKVLDFGLAKNIMQQGIADAATAQKSLTQDGMIVGTVQYMAPEQLEGGNVDARSDIYALGTILSEMATGHRPFQASNTIALIGSILHGEPPPLTDFPPSFERLVRKCLAKDPEGRWQSARDIASELRWIAEEPAVAKPEPKQSRIPMAAAGVLGALVLVAIVAVLLSMRRQETTPIVGRFSIPIPQGSALAPFSGPVAVSPDGKMIAFFTWTEGRYVLWIRPLASLEAKELPGTEGGSFPFWSADSKRIGFVAAEKLKFVEVEGGPPQVICDAANISTAAWNRDGVIIFGSAGTGLFRVAASGGRPVALTALDRSRGEIAHLWPSFLPDGDHFVYLSKAVDPNQSAIYLGALRSKETTKLVAADSNPVAAAGQLLYLIEGKLVAAPFDLAAKRVGQPRNIAENVWGVLASSGSLFSASDNGMLVYAVPGVIRTKIGWVNRAGQEIGSVPFTAEAVHVALSPSGERVLIESLDPTSATGMIWLHDIARGVTSRLTLERTWTDFPTWFRDGRQLAYGGVDGGRLPIYATSADGGPVRLLVTSDGLEHPSDVSASNDLLYVRMNPATGYDLWLLPASGSTPRPFLATPFDEVQAQFSPDQHWVAYTSNETGRLEVYVQSFPSADRKIAISTDGGSEPRWSKDGRELFYLSAGDMLTSVPMKTTPQLEPGTPRGLFKFSPRRYFGRFDYDVDPKGERFLLINRSASSEPQIVVVTNWAAELGR